MDYNRSQYRNIKQIFIHLRVRTSSTINIYITAQKNIYIHRKRKIERRAMHKKKLKWECKFISRTSNMSELSSPRYVQIIILFYIVDYSCTKDRNVSTSYSFNRIALCIILLPLLKHICMTWLKSDLTYYIFFWHLVIFSYIMIVQEMARKTVIFRDTQTT